MKFKGKISGFLTQNVIASEGSLAVIASPDSIGTKQSQNSSG